VNVRQCCSIALLHTIDLRQSALERKKNEKNACSQVFLGEERSELLIKKWLVSMGWTVLSAVEVCKVGTWLVWNAAK